MCFSIHELLPGFDVHLCRVSDVDTSRDLIDPCSYNGEEILSKFSSFSQAISDHFFLGDVPELIDGFVLSNCLFNADNVSEEPLVLTWFQVMDTAEEVLVVSDGQTRYIISLGSKNLLQDLSDKEQVSCKFLKGEGFSC